MENLCCLCVIRVKSVANKKIWCLFLIPVTGKITHWYFSYLFTLKYNIATSILGTEWFFVVFKQTSVTVVAEHYNKQQNLHFSDCSSTDICRNCSLLSLKKGKPALNWLRVVFLATIIIVNPGNPLRVHLCSLCT